MTTFRLETTLHLDTPRDRLFPFFADAFSLERITPPWLRFAVATPPPIRMAPGTLIDYRLRIRGLPVRWTSEITLWDPPRAFVDEQRRGPYRRWVHTHTFEDAGPATVVHDRVDYAVPGGGVVHRLLVAPELRRIFAHRHEALGRLFGARVPYPEVTIGTAAD